MPGTTYLDNKILNHTLRNVAFTAPTTVYLALFTSAPGKTGTGTEVTGGSYERQAITFKAASGGACLNDEVLFPTATQDWGTVGWYAIFDAATNGNMLIYDAFSASKAVSNGDTAKVGDSLLSITVD